jgi:hypothetical protein
MLGIMVPTTSRSLYRVFFLRSLCPVLHLLLEAYHIIVILVLSLVAAAE